MSRLTDEQTIQVRINTAVDEALSANNAKWREKINQEKRYHDMNAECFRVGGLDTDEEVNRLEREEAISNALESILSQMGGGINNERTSDTV